MVISTYLPCLARLLLVVLVKGILGSGGLRVTVGGDVFLEGSVLVEVLDVAGSLGPFSRSTESTSV
jgi:hypothetical protein